MNRRWALGAAPLFLVAGWLYISSRSQPTSLNVRRGCDVTISSPAHRLEIGAGGSLSVTVSGRTRACRGGTVTLSAQVNGGGSSQLGTATADAVTGAWSYTTTVADQSTTVLTASMTGGGITRTDKTSIVADTRDPVLTITAPTLTAAGNLVVVCGEDGGYGEACNVHVQQGEPGYVADADPVAPGGQLDLDLTITGANPGTLTVSQDGTQKISYAIAADPAHLTVTDLGVLSLDEGWAGNLTFNVTGPSGATQKVIPTYVKTTRPGAPVVLMGVPLPDGGLGPYPDGGAWTHVTNQRHADLDVAFQILPDAGDVARVELDMSNSTMTDLGPGTTASVTVSTTPTEMDATPDAHRTQEALNDNRSGSDGIVPTNHVYCALNNASVTPATGTSITHCGITFSPNWSCTGSASYGAYSYGTQTVLTSSDHVYCVTDTGTVAVQVVPHLAYSPSEAMSNPALHKSFDPYSPRPLRWRN